MLTLESAPPSSAPTPAEITPLVLEVAQQHWKLGRLILRPGKYLIGSAVDCQVRLPPDGVQAHHCLLLVGEKRLIAKAGDPRTWINDCPVREGTLCAGDRLTVGPVEFFLRAATPTEIFEHYLGPEFAAGGIAPASETSVSVRTASVNGTTKTIPREGEAPAEPIQAERPPLCASPGVLPGQAAPVLNELRQEIGRQLEQLQGELAQHTQALLRMERERRTFRRPRPSGTRTAPIEIGQTETARSRHAEQEASLRRAAEELEARQQEHAERMRGLEQWEQELAQREASFAEEQWETAEGLETAKQLWERECEERAEKLSREETALGRRTVELADQQAMLDGRRIQLDQEWEAWEEHRAELSRDREAVLEERCQLEAEQASLRSERSQLAEERAQLQAEREILEQAQRNAQRAAEANDAARRAERAELEAARHDLEKQANRFQQDQERWRAERMLVTEEQRRLDEERMEFLSQKAALEDARRELERSRAAWERELADGKARQQQFEQERSLLEIAQIRLEEERQELHAQAARVEADRRALDAELARLEAEEGNLRATREQLRRDQESLQSTERQCDDRLAQLAVREAELASQQAAVDSRAAEVSADQSRLQTEWERLELARSALRTAEESLQRERQALESERERLAWKPSYRGPERRRLPYLKLAGTEAHAANPGLDRRAESAAAAADVTDGSSTAEQPPEKIVELPPVVPEPLPTVYSADISYLTDRPADYTFETPAIDDPSEFQLEDTHPDSIAAYMERLLARARRHPETATDSAPAEQGAISPAADTSGTSDESPRADTEQEGSRVEPGDDLPVGQEAVSGHPAEKTRPRQNREEVRAGLQSLREVANRSARSAIALSQWKRLRLRLVAFVTLAAMSLLTAWVLLTGRAGGGMLGHAIGWIVLTAGLGASAEGIRSALTFRNLGAGGRETSPDSSAPSARESPGDRLPCDDSELCDN